MAILKEKILYTLQGLILLFPISFIFGNLVINVFVILISIMGIAYYNNKLFIWNDGKIKILTILFFFFILTSTLIQTFFFEYYDDSVKSILFLRFLFFFIVIKTMVVKKDLDLIHFFYSCLAVTLFVSLDIIIQFTFGLNLIGLEPVVFEGYSQNLVYHTGVFGKELIAGGYIQMFSVLGIFTLFNLIKPKNFFLLYILFFSLIIFLLITLLLTANRMPLMMFVIYLLILPTVIKFKNKKLYFFGSSLIAVLLFSFIILKSEIFTKRFMNFFGGIPSPTLILTELKKEYPELEKYKNSGKPLHTLKEFKNYKNYPFYTGHLTLYITSLDLFLDKPLLGRGIKSFRNNCTEKIHLPNRVCESHPHNFSLEILNDTGVMGMITIFLLVLYLIFNNYKDYITSNLKKSRMPDWIYLTIIMALILQFFPFKSSGSFFSTFNAAYTFLILGISAGLHELRHNKT